MNPEDQQMIDEMEFDIQCCQSSEGLRLKTNRILRLIAMVKELDGGLKIADESLTAAHLIGFGDAKKDYEQEITLLRALYEAAKKHMVGCNELELEFSKTLLEIDTAKPKNWHKQLGKSMDKIFKATDKYEKWRQENES